MMLGMRMVPELLPTTRSVLDSFLLYFICTQNDKIGARFGGVPQSRDGQQFPVAREDLYPNYAARDRHLDQLLETDYVSSFIIGTLPKNIFRVVVILNLLVIATVAELSSITQNRLFMQNPNRHY